MKPVPRNESYRGMIFVSFDPGVVDLVTSWPRSRASRLHARSERPGCEIVQGAQTYRTRANWKLLVENSIDPSHLRSVHQRYFRQFLPDMGFLNSRWAQRPAGIGMALDGGHSLFEAPIPPTPPAETGVPLRSSPISRRYNASDENDRDGLIRDSSVRRYGIRQFDITANAAIEDKAQL
jgi:p-cumate 2,3-dioxygenase subunit alpha